MSLLEAIFLGIIQGATEFLPISSSGHLLLVPTLFNLPIPDKNVLAIAHIGTLVAVLIYFWADIWAIGKAVLAGLQTRQPFKTSESRLGWYIVVGTIPAAVAGLTLEDFFDDVFGKPIIAALFLLVTAGLLVAGERLISGKKTLDKMSGKDAIIIGFAQMFALFPGVSRSGSTIVAGLVQGLNRELAARYSFLLGIPAIAGAGLLSVVDLLQAGSLGEELPALFLTFLSAAIVGYACIAFLLKWLRDRSLYPFAIYCVVFSLFYLVVAWIR
jgi:undecaprenyl-diphosphatase